jgi:hypothetical protein
MIALEPQDCFLYLSSKARSPFFDIIITHKIYQPKTLLGGHDVFLYVLIYEYICNYLTLRSVSSLNHPQNNETFFCEIMKLTC